jgi:hypothetical protein
MSVCAVFEVTESNGEKVLNTRKLDFLKRMLNVEEERSYNAGASSAISLHFVPLWAPSARTGHDEAGGANGAA